MIMKTKPKEAHLIQVSYREKDFARLILSVIWSRHVTVEITVRKLRFPSIKRNWKEFQAVRFDL